MKKIILSAGVLYSIFSFAQTGTGNVGINTTTPNPNAVLDVVSTNRGLLPPRVALSSTSSASPLSAHVAGMTVYNTATAGDVVPALYYNDGSKWIKATGMEPWYNQATQKEATSNTQNIYQMGNVAVGTTTPAGAKVEAFTTAANNVSFKATDGSGHINTIPNLGGGSFNAIASAGDVGIIFSTDNDGAVDANNGLVIAAHTSGGAGTNKGMKIMESGLVGIGSINPTERLDVGVGNVRIRGINTAAGNIITDNVVVADATGVLKTIPNHNYASVLAGADTADAYTGAVVTVTSPGGTTVDAIVMNRTFTLTQKSLVTFTYNLSAGNIAAANGTPITDGRAKQVGALLVWANGGGTFTNNTLIAQQSNSFTNTGTNYASGFYYFGNTKSVVMPAGTYSVDLKGKVFAQTGDAVGIQARFGGGSSDTFDIIAVPMPY